MRWSADSRPELDLCAKFMLLLQKTAVLSIQLMEFIKIRLTVMQCALSFVSFRAQSPPPVFSSFTFLSLPQKLLYSDLGSSLRPALVFWASTAPEWPAECVSPPVGQKTIPPLANDLLPPTPA